jgi:hypothetical protein
MRWRPTEAVCGKVLAKQIATFHFTTAVPRKTSSRSMIAVNSLAIRRMTFQAPACVTASGFAKVSRQILDAAVVAVLIK